MKVQDHLERECKEEAGRLRQGTKATCRGKLDAGIITILSNPPANDVVGCCAALHDSCHRYIYFLHACILFCLPQASTSKGQDDEPYVKGVPRSGQSHYLTGLRSGSGVC